MPNCIRDPRTRTRRGSTFVEGALIITTVIFTLIGIMDMGQVLVLHQGLVERVRAGARYAVVSANDPTKITNVVLYATDSPREGARPFFGLAAGMVSVSQFDVGTPEARIRVSINNYPFRFFTPWIAGAYVAWPIAISMPVESQGALQ